MSNPRAAGPRSRPFFWGAQSGLVALVAVAGLLIDQAAKLWVIFSLDLPSRGRIELLPVLDLTMVWNYGISYGLFQQGSAAGQLILVGLTILATVFLWVWGARTTNRLAAFSIGLIVGGAIGNGIDRIAYGAVADFFHFHVGTFSWYVFNPADVWIVAGVAGLVYESFFAGPKDAALPPHVMDDVMDDKVRDGAVRAAIASQKSIHTAGYPAEDAGATNSGSGSHTQSGKGNKDDQDC